MRLVNSGSRLVLLRTLRCSAVPLLLLSRSYVLGASASLLRGRVSAAGVGAGAGADVGADVGICRLRRVVRTVLGTSVTTNGEGGST